MYIREICWVRNWGVGVNVVGPCGILWGDVLNGFVCEIRVVSGVAASHSAFSHFLMAAPSSA